MDYKRITEKSFLKLIKEVYTNDIEIVVRPRFCEDKFGPGHRVIDIHYKNRLIYRFIEKTKYWPTSVIVFYEDGTPPKSVWLDLLCQVRHSVFYDYGKLEGTAIYNED